MTAPLPAGSLLVDPADVGLLLALVRAGAQTIARQRGLPTQVRDVMAAVEQAASAARAAAGFAIASASTASAPASASSVGMTTSEVAGFLGVTPQRVRQLVKAGVLPATRVGKRLLTIDPDDVAALVLSQRTGKVA